MLKIRDTETKNFEVYLSTLKNYLLISNEVDWVFLTLGLDVEVSSFGIILDK